MNLQKRPSSLIYGPIQVRDLSEPLGEAKTTPDGNQATWSYTSSSDILPTACAEDCLSQDPQTCSVRTSLPFNRPGSSPTCCGWEPRTTRTVAPYKGVRGSIPSPTIGGVASCFANETEGCRRLNTAVSNTNCGAAKI